MGMFSRSWHVTKLSFRTLRKDKEMLLFPILGGVFSLLFLIAMVIPTSLWANISNNSLIIGDYVLLFIMYLGLGFIATFFNVCTVFTAKTRFEGKNASFADSISFALSKIGKIFAWSMVSATVGILLRLLDHLAEKLGSAGKIAMKIFNSVLGAAWSILTIFVVPSMVYENIGPIDAMKKSIKTLKHTWGDLLVKGITMGLIQFMFILLGIGVTVGLIMLASDLFMYIMIALVVYMVLLFLIFNVANTIFNTALYHFATTGKAPEGFDTQTLKGALKHKK